MPEIDIRHSPTVGMDTCKTGRNLPANQILFYKYSQFQFQGLFLIFYIFVLNNYFPSAHSPFVNLVTLFIEFEYEMYSGHISSHLPQPVHIL